LRHRSGVSICTFVLVKQVKQDSESVCVHLSHSVEAAHFDLNVLRSQIEVIQLSEKPDIKALLRLN
jgi:hypothetical protein